MMVITLMAPVPASAQEKRMFAGSAAGGMAMSLQGSPGG